MHISSACAHCKESTKSKRREFTEQTWTVLLVWGEVDRGTVDHPLCDNCYEELREILIDRADEIEVALTQPIPVQKPQKAPAVAAATESDKTAARGRKLPKMAS